MPTLRVDIFPRLPTACEALVEEAAHADLLQMLKSLLLLLVNLAHHLLLNERRLLGGRLLEELGFALVRVLLLEEQLVALGKHGLQLRGEVALVQLALLHHGLVLLEAVRVDRRDFEILLVSLPLQLRLKLAALLHESLAERAIRLALLLTDRARFLLGAAHVDLRQLFGSPGAQPLLALLGQPALRRPQHGRRHCQLMLQLLGRRPPHLGNGTRRREQSLIWSEPPPQILLGRVVLAGRGARPQRYGGRAGLCTVGAACGSGGRTVCPGGGTRPLAVGGDERPLEWRTRHVLVATKRAPAGAASGSCRHCWRWVGRHKIVVRPACLHPLRRGAGRGRSTRERSGRLLDVDVVGEHRARRHIDARRHDCGESTAGRSAHRHTLKQVGPFQMEKTRKRRHGVRAYKYQSRGLKRNSHL